MAYTNLEISVVDGDSTVNIDTIVANPPLASPLAYTVRVECADGTVRQHGRRVCAWRFTNLSEAEFDALRALIPGKSATVWIRTLDENKFDYAYMTGVVVWPDEETIARPVSPVDSTGEFILTFQNLIPYTPTPPP